MEKSYSKFILYSFLITFLLTALTVHTEDAKSPVEFLGIIFERQMVLFIISIFWTMGTLIGIFIFNKIFNKNLSK